MIFKISASSIFIAIFAIGGKFYFANEDNKVIKRLNGEAAAEEAVALRAKVDPADEIAGAPLTGGERTAIDRFCANAPASRVQSNSPQCGCFATTITGATTHLERLVLTSPKTPANINGRIPVVTALQYLTPAEKDALQAGLNQKMDAAIRTCGVASR